MQQEQEHMEYRQALTTIVINDNHNCPKYYMFLLQTCYFTKNCLEFHCKWYSYCCM